MKFDIGTQCHGFTVEQSVVLDELASQAYRLRHDKTKADLIAILNDDDNKVFMITFATPPHDDTGVPHILEHSVLNGSQKFPVKEPFAELLKSSLYTFLNAMTYPDKTVYPVASRNAKDFHNLVEVYLDAVFRPLLSENTFLQEGWHYAVEKAQARLRYSGVVYNEMLGAYSDPENILDDSLNAALYSDTIYRFSSGGDPDAIPSLTYAQFRDFYRRYYHPSNSRILLYGNIQVAECLAQIQEYVSGYEYQEPELWLQRQSRYKTPIHREATYPITSEETVERKAYLLRGYLLGEPTDPDYYLAMTILARILIGTPGSPLRKALIDSHLGDSTLNYGFEEESFENQFGIGLKGADPENLKKMEAVIDETLTGLVRDGIGAKAIEASMNSVEFHLREANFGGYPKGLCYGLAMLNSWLYGGDPFAHLRYEKVLAALKSKVASGRYFESLIERYFLQNPHQATITLRPDKRMEARRVQEIQDRLQVIRAEMSTEDVAALLDQNHRLLRAQEEPDSPEALARLPKLSLQDVDKVNEIFPFATDHQRFPRFSFSQQSTCGIAYLMFAFDASGVSQEDLPLLPILIQCTLQAGTRRHNFVDFIQEIDVHTGGIGGAYAASPLRHDRDSINSFVIYKGKSLCAKVPELLRLCAEMLTECDFTQHERLKEIVRVAKSGLQSRIVPAGHSYVGCRLNSYDSRAGRYRELTCGLSQFHFLESLLAQVESDPAAVARRLQGVAETLFTWDNLHIHLTGGDHERQIVDQALAAFLDCFPRRTPQPVPYVFSAPVVNEGFIIPSKIQYVGKGVNLYNLGYRYNGTIEVLDTILSRDYLWNHVRVRGGAYGCFTQFEMLSGYFACISYRDPNLKETIAIFDRIAEFLQRLELTDADYERLVIGTIGSLDAPKTPDQKGASAFSRHLSGVTLEELQTRRDQILSSRKEQIKEYADLLAEFARVGHCCVIGAEGVLRQSDGLLATVQPVFR